MKGKSLCSDWDCGPGWVRLAHSEHRLGPWGECRPQREGWLDGCCIASETPCQGHFLPSMWTAPGLWQDGLSQPVAATAFWHQAFWSGCVGIPE